jgi:hypothetical protein
MASAIETHPQRQKIIDAIISGQGCDTIARNAKPRLNKVTVWRYAKNVVKPALEKAAAGAKVLAAADLQLPPPNGITENQGAIDATRAVIAADPILSRMEQRRLDRERLLKTAEDSADLRGWAAIDRNDISATELEARLTGRLDSQPTGGQVAVVVLPVAGLPGPAAPVPQVLPAGAVRFLPEGE